jgi:hypothetical protein
MSRPQSEKENMKSLREAVHTLEQQETGEIRRLCCAVCGRRSFRSPKELELHEVLCVQTQLPSTDAKHF